MNEIRALGVYDSAEEAERIAEELRRGGYRVRLHRVSTRAEMARALAEQAFDAILSDYRLAAFSALEAIALVKERDLDTPFVMVSESIGEQTAIRVMKAGVHNCIFRGELGRLAPTLEREFREAATRRERRAAQKALRDSEARFRALAETASDAILIVDEAGRILFANGAAGQTFGAPASSLIGEALTSLLPGETDVGALLESASPTASAPATREMVGRHASGDAIPLEASLGRLSRDSRQYLTLIVRDVRARKRAEEAIRRSEERFRLAAQSSSDRIYEWDLSTGRIVVYGWKEERGGGPEPIPDNAADRARMIHPADRARVRAAIEASLATGRRFRDEYRVVLPDGQVRTWLDSGRPLADANGRFARWIGAITDVTERERSRRAAAVSENRYRMLFERNLAGVYRMTLDGRILDCNDSFARIFGYDSREEVLRQPDWDFYPSPEDRHASLLRLRERRTLSNYEHCLRRKDGTPVWVLENGSLFENEEGAFVEGTLIDITERKRAEEQVQHLAFHDSLTGLPNRLLFTDRLNLAIVQAHRNDQFLATFFLDLDRFKTINDSLGHALGDDLLRRAAERICGAVREGDTVARLGGDEFTVLAPGLSREEDALKIAHKILETLRIPFYIDRRELFLTTSIGVSVYPSDGADADTLIRNADTAMYRAKEKGRDNYQLYAPEMNAKALERLSLENRLRQAVQQRELVLYYQPLIDLAKGRIRGAEALLRWQHPTLGLLSPGDFISLAELSGLIVPIGQWVLQTACAQLRAWHEMGFPSLSIAVNLSPRQFQQADLLFHVTEALRRTQLDPARLDLEITESNAMESAETSISTLWDLKKLGVNLSMDDFGTGYSSLNYLKRFPIDRIKIDQSFVRDVTHDPDDAAIATAVIAMAHSLELVVVAEGVETQDQLAFLRRHRCDEMQGFLFSRPIPAYEFSELLRSGGQEAVPRRAAEN